ncbi:hypothetical protein BDD12DRAFT_889504 [Trichophaea hybrida]|nr:hypothetical protein BDD12DRAFT_889504 [Trichophaea hybrida]
MFLPRSFILSGLMALATLATAIYLINSTAVGKKDKIHKFPTPKFDRVMLKQHNRLRKEYNLAPLEWDKSLQEKARELAMGCDVEFPLPYGQTVNVAWMHRFDAVGLFESFDGFHPNNTAMMLSDQPKKVGCVEAACQPLIGPSGIVHAIQEMPTIHVVCLYSPPW